MAKKESIKKDEQSKNKNIVKKCNKKPLEDMNIFELHQLSSIVKGIKQNFGDFFVKSTKGIIDETLMGPYELGLMKKFKDYQNLLNKIEKLIEEKVYNEYIKEG